MHAHLEKTIRRAWPFGVMAAAVVAAMWFSRTPGPLAGNTALWVQSLYYRGYQPTTKQPLTRDDVVQFARTLRESHVRYAYMFAGPYEKDGHLPEYAFGPTAQSTTRLLKSLCPDVVILPWVGGVVNKTVFPADRNWVANAVADTRRLVDLLQVPGVHVNFEFFTYAIPGEFYPGPDHLDTFGEDQRRFHEELRKALPKTFVSTVMESTASQARHWKRKNTSEEVLQLAALVDQVAILFFDTSIKDQDSFTAALRAQVDDIRRWKTAVAPKRVQFLLGVGTFVNKRELWGFRDLRVESVPNTIRSAEAVIRERKDPEHSPDGVAIFADWTTSPAAWNELRGELGPPQPTPSTPAGTARWP